MKNLVKLTEVVELAKTTGHLGWFKINTLKILNIKKKQPSIYITTKNDIKHF